MNSNARVWLFALALAIATSTSLAAHHGTNVSYQGDKSITLTGTVTEWRFAYPHPQVYFDVKDDAGKLVHWAAEIAPTPVMMKALHVGWSKESMKAGDQITITMHPSKVTDSPVGLAMEIAVNGKKIPLANPQQAPAAPAQ